MTWNDYLVIAALLCILVGTGLCRFLGAILLNTAAVMVAVAWHNEAL